MKVKICGFTNKNDVLNAIALNVDAIGFIFYENSPRYISIEKMESFIVDIPPFLHTFGVFVNASKEYILEAFHRCKLSGIQLHGEEPPEFCMNFSVPTVKALRIKNESDIHQIPKYKGCVNGILLDTKVEKIHGGSGKTFDWGLAIKGKAYDIPLLLSGGINSNNIEKAIKMVNPYGIDISSGVEKEPGIKDYHKMKEIVAVIKNHS
jgi:phosphoribosylanthranilate isomerase